MTNCLQNWYSSSPTSSPGTARTPGAVHEIGDEGHEQLEPGVALVVHPHREHAERPLEPLEPGFDFAAALSSRDGDSGANIVRLPRGHRVYGED